MEIRLLAFAGLRDIIGEKVSMVELPEGSTISDAWKVLEQRHPGLAAVPRPPAAVNQSYERENVTLRDGDELAFIPPVSGG